MKVENSAVNLMIWRAIVDFMRVLAVEWWGQKALLQWIQDRMKDDYMGTAHLQNFLLSLIL